MEHTKNVKDTDLHFSIDATTREIKTSSPKYMLMQHDHNSERFSFDIQRYVEGHDMYECNVVEVHYTNVLNGVNKKDYDTSEYKGVYPVDDVTISSDNKITGTWLVSRNATRLPGNLYFLIRFACVDDECNVVYQWFTDIYKIITIGKGMYNTSVVTEDADPDVLAVWKAEIVGATNENRTACENAMKMSKESANKCAISETNAKDSESKCLIYKNDSELSVKNSERYAKMSKSYAVGATGTREGEDEDNAKLYCEQSKSLRNESMNKLNEVHNIINESKKALMDVNFVLNDSTGMLMYESTSYDFKIDEQSGSLLWGVK